MKRPGLLAAATLLSLTGCALLEPGQVAADDHADTAGIVLTRFSTTTDEPNSYVAQRVTGVNSSTAIDALVADGTSWHGEIVLRITVYPTAKSSNQVVRCYRYVMTRYADGKPQRVDCPALPPLPPPPPTSPPPTLPRDAVSRLTSALAALPPGARSDTGQVLAAARQAFTGTAAEAGVGTAPDGSVGVSVTTGPGLDCLAARIPPGGDPLVWVPPRVLVQPGELGCSAAAFARGLGVTPPH